MGGAVDMLPDPTQPVTTSARPTASIPRFDIRPIPTLARFAPLRWYGPRVGPAIGEGSKGARRALRSKSTELHQSGALKRRAGLSA